MKKIKSLLSIALVLAMALSILPATFASAADDTVSVTYTFNQGKTYKDIGTDITKYTYTETDNTWEGVFVHNVDNRTGLSGPHLNASGYLCLRYVGSWVALKINVPYSGYYDNIRIKTVTSETDAGKASKDIDVYISGANIFDDNTDVKNLPVFAENLEIYTDTDINGGTTGTFGYVNAEISKYLSAGDNYLVFYVEGQKHNATSSLNDSQTRIYEITLSGVKATAPTAVFSAATNVDSYDVTVKVDGTKNTNEVISAPRGSAIKATAPEIPGYKFVGWKRGSNNENDDYKSYISDKNPLEMSLLTNTFVTACYVEDDYEAQAMVEYYNQNGDYIETKSADEAAPTPDAITGFTFEAGNWFIGENTKLDLTAVTNRTRAVARHTPNANAGTATVNGTLVSDKTAFDSAITPVATEGFTAWKRDGKVVSYNQEYTYYLWDTTEIEESTEAIPDSAKSGDKKLPLIVLESGNGGAYMIEYDKADFEIVEVGILFSTAGEPTVDSCTAKYTSQRNSAHGQFTAKASGTAKGYLIYKDGDAYKVIYATAE